MVVIRNCFGQMFIELVVGIAIVMVTLVGVVSLSTASLKTGRMAGNRNGATVAAEKFLEKIRRERDSDPGTFFAGVSRTDTCDAEVSSPYTCQVVYTLVGSTMTVQVTVSWVDGEGVFNVTEKTILTNN